MLTTMLLLVAVGALAVLGTNSYRRPTAAELAQLRRVQVFHVQRAKAGEPAPGPIQLDPARCCRRSRPWVRWMTPPFVRPAAFVFAGVPDTWTVLWDLGIWPWSKSSAIWVHTFAPTALQQLPDEALAVRRWDRAVACLEAPPAAVTVHGYASVAQWRAAVRGNVPQWQRPAWMPVLAAGAAGLAACCFMAAIALEVALTVGLTT
ncbi:hypothetical protein CLV92_12030 [Kineococcus xinjiangensis]|uniref:Uncharacterized protein n=1 Tax=Kineococcus xinjiangensis TaxID=512762 RepID=A0A2S6ICI5_9ACTN|nr:hypothetical protein [Kineococcus xinjiangensis]PPK91911.1 hypothetical protein CLV92_12030 [Kineococcus xinjiangensis]